MADEERSRQPNRKADMFEKVLQRGARAVTEPAKDRYRLEEIGEQEEGLASAFPSDLVFEWGLVRNHDDELICIYGTRAEAEKALTEANQ